MTYFGQAWIDEAVKKYGEAPHLQLDVRPVGTGQPVTTLTSFEDVIGMNPVVTEREAEFGVVQGQAWQVELTNMTLVGLSNKLPGGWARLKAGYPTADVWAELAVGRILSSPASTKGVISFEVEDQLVALINATLKRDIRFSEDHWASEIKASSLSDSSKNYDNNATDAGILFTVDPTGHIADETFVIEFTSATAFKVILEDGDEDQNGFITGNLTLHGITDATDYAQIRFEGWSTDTGAYAAGDRFTFDTSYARSAGTLGAVGLIRHIIEVVAGILVYDFDTDAMVSPIYNPSKWLGFAVDTAGDQFAGTFKKGTRIIDMIQGIMPVPHVSLFSMPNGKIGIWMLEPATEGGLVLNGNHDGSDVSIINGIVNPNILKTYNRVVYNYKSLADGSDVSYEAVDDATIFSDDRVLEIDLPWEIRGLSVKTGADRALVRFKDAAEPYTVETTFDGATAEVGGVIVINDDTLGASNKQVAVVKIARDPMNGQAAIEALIEKITLGEYFIIGDFDTDPIGSRIGDAGDPGAGRIW